MSAKKEPASTPLVGETRAARDFYAGSYAKVVAETVDAPTMAVDDADIAFAVGALTFLGRVDEAQTLFDGFREASVEPSDRTVAASRFFLGVAYARAGDFAAAARYLAEGALGRARVADAWSRSFVFQGLAAHRYFTGHHRKAAHHALRAQRAAQVARFSYVQMLATDLRGHALVQLGRFQAGTALLEQARGFAERLGFGMNAHAIACSIAIYKAKFKVSADALAGLEALLARRSHDSYSKRMLLAQSAIQYALRGRAREARQALAQADEDALRVDGRRAKVASLLARLYDRALLGGARAATADALAHARDLTEHGDVSFERDLRPFPALRRGRARCTASRAPAFAEDEIAPVLEAALRRDEHRRALARGRSARPDPRGARARAGPAHHDPEPRRHAPHRGLGRSLGAPQPSEVGRDAARRARAWRDQGGHRRGALGAAPLPPRQTRPARAHDHPPPARAPRAARVVDHRDPVRLRPRGRARRDGCAHGRGAS
ncbi:MAG: hypothetical protein U0271_10315 [Polyangiaceae bacterium]